MTTWFTADPHFGHANIIRYCGRPVGGVDEMDRVLIDRWNEVVDPDDEVWVLGDFAIGQIDRTLPLAARLHGRKVLVAGNHDRCWAEHGPKAQGWTERYLAAGFDEVRQGSVPLEVAGVAVLAGHFPYLGDSQGEDRYTAQRPEDRGDWLLHGHVHDRWQQHGRMINVGVDAWDLRPVSEAAIAELLRAGPQDRPPAPWT